MTLFWRSLVVGAFAVLVAACGGAGRSDNAHVPASSRASPCGSVNLPAAWSPNGKQIVWYGYRWPLPPLHHRPAGISVLRAICVSDSDGKHLAPLRYTVCSTHCTRELDDGVGQLYWAAPKLLVYGNDSGVFAIAIGRKPVLLTRKGAPEPFVADAAGDRVATGIPECTGCVGPVTVLDIPSGKLVGEVGGNELGNTEPSLSPDGAHVVFARFSKSGLPKGIWTANADGSNLQRLEPSGVNPLWSPAGDQITYVVPSGTSRGALRIVSPHGGASTTLLRYSPGTVFGWSPDGGRIAVGSSGGLAVVDVAAGRVRMLLKLHRPYDASSVAWSPDSQQLLVVWRPPLGSGCPSGLWRVPIDGARPRLVHGC